MRIQAPRQRLCRGAYNIINCKKMPQGRVFPLYKGNKVC